MFSTNMLMIENFLKPKLEKNWQFGNLQMHLPNGKIWQFNGIGNDCAKITIKNPKFFKRILMSHDIGLFESYQNNEWECDDLCAALKILSANYDAISQLFSNSIYSNINNFLHRLNVNSKKGSKRNIHAHYDLGNDFYQSWLDESMTYSAGVFKDDCNLENAQIEKYRALANSIDLKAGQNILEIGCGWGGFAQYAAKMGANVTCITISKAQYDFTCARINANKLCDKVKVELLDYRDLSGQYDAIVSIEMFEAVGMEYWNIYFEKLKKCLKPNAKAALQIITIRDDLFDEYSQKADFIQKYIFPGGMLPSVDKLGELAKNSGLKMAKLRDFGLDYAKTLEIWNSNFEKAWQSGKINGFDNRFKRLWQFYLSYCQAGFETARTSVVHISLEKAA
jgi:cyclopropane-fatty-acyl-phospholipid synthase